MQKLKIIFATLLLSILISSCETIKKKTDSIVEKENQIAMHQSSRNSGVMHAGLYYKPGSLKSRLCREGINLMKTYNRFFI